MFMGTDDGLYFSMDAAATWQKWTHGFPTVSTKDLVIHPREHDLVVGTFGRAAWVLDDIRPLRAMASDPDILTKDISVFTPPTAYLAASQQASGTRFGADAIFNATNRTRGAMITYFLKDGASATKPKMEGEQKGEETQEDSEQGAEEIQKEKAVSKDSVFVRVYEQDRLIRTLKYKTPDSAGLHRVYWRLDEAGPDRPSRTLQKRKREPGGVDVRPGTYRVEVSLGEVTDETQLVVESDPRLEVSPAAIEARYTEAKKLDTYLQTSANAVKQLAESKKVADTYAKDLKGLDKEKYKAQIKASKDISTKIDSLLATYIGKEDKRQGITRNPEMTVTRRIYNAYGYVQSRPNGMTSTEQRLIEYAERDLKNALVETNAFFANDWKAYQQEMEGLDLSPFKETETFLLEK